ncbi:MAG: RagB/SusD family nutrient uptake outer membrane protein [Bacteroidales bacterium]|nr:RagB/SusD family nutrient uptake outer membrane protein [Bacteroidales bacterium]
MKNIISILFIATILIFAGCSEDFLDRKPYDQRVVGNFYQTPEDGFEALVAVYDMLQWGGGENSNDYNNIHIITEIASDNCYGGAGTSDNAFCQDVDQFINFFDGHAQSWERFYRGIYRANLFLESANDIDWGSDPYNLEKKYKGEAHFLRAFFYFNLVRMFGNVPLLTETIAPEDAYIAQADPEDVYEFIAEDLIIASNNLPGTPYSGPNEESGRATKWAAQSLYARVFLYYTGYYNTEGITDKLTKSRARSYIDSVINVSGHELLDDFKRLWQFAPFEGSSFAGEDNAETVFAIKYTWHGQGDQNIHDGNRWQVMIGLRDEIVAPFSDGWGLATVNPSLYAEWPEGDTRRDNTILAWEELGIDYHPESQREYTGYNWKKYCPLTTIDSTERQTDSLNGNFMWDNFFDDIIIRFADVLLMGAELHLDDNLTLAQDYFDRVRDRAFQNIDHRIVLANDINGFQTIMEERRWELALEGQRYWDLLRQGIDVTEEAINTTSPYERPFRRETMGLFAIPETQIELSNGTLYQNPGWPQ